MTGNLSAFLLWNQAPKTLQNKVGVFEILEKWMNLRNMDYFSGTIPKLMHVRAACWSSLEVPQFVIKLHNTSSTQLQKKYEKPIMIDNLSVGSNWLSIMKLQPIPNPSR